MSGDYEPPRFSMNEAHSLGIDPWFVCEYPERAPDDLACFHAVRCRGCAVVAEALLNQFDPLTQSEIWTYLHAVLDLTAGPST